MPVSEHKKMKPAFKFKIEKMSESDIEEVLHIQSECGLSAWSYEGYKSETVNPYSLCLIVKADSQLAGFLIAGFNPDDGSGELYNIGIRQKYRRSGMGRGLMQSLIKRAVESGVTTIFLEARESNTEAICFYEKHGFKALGTRKNFYTNPHEDGISMRLAISRE